MSHVNDEDLRLLAAGRLDPACRREILQHLLGRCAVCLGRAQSLAQILATEEIPPAHLPILAETEYDEATLRAVAWAKAYAERIRWEQARREGFLAEVRPLHLPFEEILARLAEARLATRSEVEVLLTLSFEERFRDPGRMLQLVLAARVASRSMPHGADAADYSEAERADLEARTLAELANALRVIEDLPQAEKALEQAEVARREGSGDVHLHGVLLEVAANLQTDQRRYEEAYDLRKEAITLYQEIGETHLAGRALVSQGIGLHYDGEPVKAIAELRRALSLLEAGRDPILFASGRQALLDAMAANGEYAEAGALLLRSGLREAFAEEPFSRLKVRWLEGRIFAGLGKVERARVALTDARESFLAEGLDYEAALVGLEAAGIELAAGEWDVAELLAREALEIFELLEIHPEASRALRHLQKAFAGRKATVGLVRRVVTFLERLERRPGLLYWPAS